MTRVLANLLIATTFFAFASPAVAVAEKYYLKCKGSNVDNVIETVKKPYHDVYYDMCGKRFHLSKDKADAINRRCKSGEPWMITTTGRTRICGGNGW